jgi:hypothetical protein
MGDDTTKFKNSKRRLNDDNAIAKQVKIAKSAGSDISQPHKFAKHHAMDCGNPKCMLCGNPRKVWKELTLQEKRQHQNMEIARLRHSNGIYLDKDE